MGNFFKSCQHQTLGYQHDVVSEGSGFRAWLCASGNHLTLSTAL
jgi:hypothetical protein